MIKTIGILGGIGPDSSALFYTRLIELFEERFSPKDNTEFMRIILNSIPATSLVSGDNESKLEEYINGLKFLERESDFIVMVCNTAYIYFEKFQNMVHKPILNLPLILSERLASAQFTSQIILASENTLKSGIFRSSKLEQIQIAEEDEALIQEVISRQAVGNGILEDKSAISSIIEKYRKEQCVIVIACTELSLLLNEWQDSNKIDTMDLLLSATLNFYESVTQN